MTPDRVDAYHAVRAPSHLEHAPVGVPRTADQFEPQIVRRSLTGRLRTALFDFHCSFHPGESGTTGGHLLWDIRGRKHNDHVGRLTDPPIAKSLDHFGLGWAASVMISISSVHR